MSEKGQSPLNNHGNRPIARNKNIPMRHSRRVSVLLYSVSPEIAEERTWATFLLIPALDKKSLFYHGTIALIVALDVLLLLITASDGPNHHSQENSSNAKYSELPSAQELFIIRLIINIILFVAGAVEVTLVIIDFFSDMIDEYSTSSFIQFIAVVAFIINQSIHKFHEPYISHYSASRDVLTILELGKMLWFFGFANVLTEVQSLKLTLINSSRALLVPLFFLVVVDIFFATILYFLEPCYNRDICAWSNIFEACFFGLVTMARVGYGNQTPNSIVGMILTVMLTLVGGTILGMPLAVITTKYSEAYELCKILKESLSMEEVLKLDFNRATMTRGDIMKKLQEQQLTHTSEESNIEQRLNIFSEHCNLISMFRLFDETLRDAVEKIKNTQKYQNNTNRNTTSNGADTDDSFRLLHSRKSKTTNTTDSEGGDDCNDPSQDSGGKQNLTTKSKNRISNRGKSSSSSYKYQMIGNNDGNDRDEDDIDLKIGNSGLRKKIDGPSLHLLPPLPSLPSLPSLTSTTSGTGTTSMNMKGFVKNKYQVLPDIDSSPGTHINDNPNPDENVTDRHNINENNQSKEIELQNMSNNLSKYSQNNVDFSLIVSEESTIEERNRTRRMMEYRRLVRLELQAMEQEREQKQRLKEGILSEEYSKNFDAAAGRIIAEYKDHITKKIHGLLKTLDGMDPAKNFKKKDEMDNSLKGRVQRVMGRLKEKERPKGRGALLRLNKVSMADRLAETFEKAQHNSFRYQLFLLLYMPYSSRWAYITSKFMQFIIFLSTIVFILQSMSSFQLLGETTEYCEQVTQAYCSSKHDNTLDPGCFVYNSTVKLDYNCNSNNCFGQNYNFGSSNADISLKCDTVSSSSSSSSSSYAYGPFRSAEYLREVTTLSSQRAWQRNTNPCVTLECVSNTNNHDQFNFDGNILWRPLEVIFALTFTLELIGKMIASSPHFRDFSSIVSWIIDPRIVVDIVALLPFYIEIVYAGATHGGWPDFNTLSSSPLPTGLLFVRFLKVFRILKILVHVRSAKIVSRTIYESGRKFVVNTFVLLLIALPCGYLMYVLERGRPCISNNNIDIENNSVCGINIESAGDFYENKLLMINDDQGTLSTIPNAFFGYWVTVITITAQGYGNRYAVTPAGMCISVIYIIFGSIYLSIPVAVMCDSFMKCFNKVVDDERKAYLRMRNTVNRMARKGVRSNLLKYDAPPIMETGDPEVDKALMRTTEANRKILAEAIKKATTKYYDLRETMGRGILTADGDAGKVLKVVGTCTRACTSMGSSVEELVQAMTLYKAM